MPKKTQPTGQHRFGGPWTEVKLDAVSEYLQFYVGALQKKPSANNPFVLWYVDAFAGSGERTTQRQSGGLFEGAPAGMEQVQLPGSAARALLVDPPFSRYVFIEKDADRTIQLKALVEQSKQDNVTVYQGDANERLREIFSCPPWTQRGLHRAVVFLDPYDMAVKWNTLEILSATKAVDVWYLFPLNATVRQLARDYSAVDEPKRASLTQIFGTSEWMDELYAEEAGNDLFDEPIARTTRSATQRQIESYAKRRLRSLFPYVSDPLPLLTPRGAQLFSLFCLSANDSVIAHNLISRGVSHVLRKFG